MISVRYFIMAGIAFFLFYVLLRKVVAGRKLQAKFPVWSDYRRDLLYSASSMLIFASIILLVFVVFRPYTQIYRDSENVYGYTYYILSFLMMILIQDTYFYWIHRLMHHPKLYRLVHLVHHKSTNPSPWTSYSFHPLEAVLEAGIIPLIAFMMPVEHTALVGFLIWQFVYNVYGHLGYELFPKGFGNTLIGRWINTSTAHNGHHRLTIGNYGLYFMFWDRLMGTCQEGVGEREGALGQRDSAGALAPKPKA